MGPRSTYSEFLLGAFLRLRCSRTGAAAFERFHFNRPFHSLQSSLSQVGAVPGAQSSASVRAWTEVPLGASRLAAGRTRLRHALPHEPLLAPVGPRQYSTRKKVSRVHCTVTASARSLRVFPCSRLALPSDYSPPDRPPGGDSVARRLLRVCSLVARASCPLYAV